MSVEVIIGHGDADDEHRTAAREWVTSWWQARGFTVRTGSAPSDPWVKAVAFNPPADASTADLLIVADADALVPLQQVQDALERATRHGWAIPARIVHRLKRDATQTLLACDPAETETPPDRSVQRKAHELLAGGGMVMVTREAWQASRGFDPAFVGWGGEDAAFGAALQCATGHGTFAAKADAHGPYFHLWHPPQQTTMSINRANAMRAIRYRQAKGDPARMATVREA